MTQPGAILSTCNRVAFIVNPRSGSGRGAKNFAAMLPKIRAMFGDSFEVFETSGPNDATRLTREALRNGFDRIVSAGGDGTHFEVVNGFFDGTERIAPDASMAILPIGTASDYRKSLAIPTREVALDLLNADRATPIDIGRVTSTREDGSEHVAHFNTAVHIGIGGLVGEHTNSRSKLLGGFMTFYIGVITARIAWRNVPMRVVLDDDEIIEESMMEVIAANGFYDGGGMHVAPKGVLDDGLFEVYAIGNLGLVGIILNIPRLYRGTHDTHPAVKYRRARKITVEAKSRVVVSPDGEVTGILPATIEIVPRAVNIVAGPGLRVGG